MVQSYTLIHLTLSISLSLPETYTTFQSIKTSSQIANNSNLQVRNNHCGVSRVNARVEQRPASNLLIVPSIAPPWRPLYDSIVCFNRTNRPVPFCGKVTWTAPPPLLALATFLLFAWETKSDFAKLGFEFLVSAIIIICCFCQIDSFRLLLLHLRFLCGFLPLQFLLLDVLFVCLLKQPYEI